MNVHLRAVSAAEDTAPEFETSSRRPWFWTRASRDLESRKWRSDRDTERGYSINVKKGAGEMRNALLAAVVAGVTTFAISGEAHSATWKETQKGGWERSCHDVSSTACTVWENPTQEVLCRGCPETPYKVSPPVPGEPVVKVQQAQQHHITAEEIISYKISNLTQKEVQDFAAQFKQFTGVDFTDKVLLQLRMWGHAAAVDVSMAEASNVIPSSHDARHCRTTAERDTTCFEQWLYTNLEEQLPAAVSEKGSQRTKLVSTDKAGRLEAIQYCQGRAGVIACAIDIEGEQDKQAYWFGLKDEKKGLIAQLYWPKESKQGK
jgi:hypothetical protein